MLFVHTFAGLDWGRYCVSVQGLVDNTSGQCLMGAAGAHLVAPELLLTFQARVQASGASSPLHFRRATVDILDPLVTTNNLGISMSELVLEHLDEMLQSIKGYDWQGRDSAQFLRDKGQAWVAGLALGSSEEIFPTLQQAAQR